MALVVIPTQSQSHYTKRGYAMEWLNKWLMFLNESKFVAIPYGCKLVKKQQHRNAFLKKIPIANGGGEREMMKVKNVEEYECFIKNVPKKTNTTSPKSTKPKRGAKKTKEKKQKPMLEDITNSKDSGKIGARGIVIRVGEFEKN